jgi:hypothetical protein
MNQNEWLMYLSLISSIRQMGCASFATTGETCDLIVLENLCLFVCTEPVNYF